MTLGDSFTFGNAARLEDIFPKVLARRLLEELESVEVVNTSAGGWNADTELAFFLQEGLSYEPDILILAFFPNDWISPPQPGQATPRVELSADARVEGRPSWLRWLPYRAIYLFKRSATVMYLRDRIAVASAGPDFVSDLLQNRVDLDRNATIAYTYSELRRLKAACDEHGIPVVIAAIPPVNFFWVPRDSIGYVKHLQHFAESNGMTFVDLAEGFWPSVETTRLFMYPWDNHLSREGHRLAAEQLAPIVARVARGLPGRVVSRR